uniref:Uncharacterized protein LOC102808160 n=1 Tax=Saccoglossus kowalevskii TaxID=10224 RepID=A0ABM0LZI7_SACKO|nr:PREDICTED: uncharacterized protein LOC102808160 [Saccoglossus kowalevskii]
MQEEDEKKNGAELSAIELSVERLAQKTEQLLQQHRPQYVYNPPQFEGPRINEDQTVGTASLAYQGRKFNTIPICGICNKQGHSAAGCYSRENYFSGNCYNCGKRGHIAKKCRGRVQKRDLRDITCYSCGVKGHIGRNCNNEKQGDNLNPKGRAENRPTSHEKNGRKPPFVFNVNRYI